MESKLLKAMFANFRRESRRGRLVGKGIYTADAAFTFRMNTGFVGDVTRTHPMPTIEPCLVDSTTPPLLFGQAVMADMAAPNGVRLVQAGDNGAAAIYGITVRPFPFQPQSATNFGATTFGGEAPPNTGAIDVLKAGYILVKLNGAAAAFKGSPVYVWVAASGGGHIQGSFEAVATGGSTIALDATGSRTYFNGPAGADGLVELAFNL